MLPVLQQLVDAYGFYFRNLRNLRTSGRSAEWNALVADNIAQAAGTPIRSL